MELNPSVKLTIFDTQWIGKTIEIDAKLCQKDKRLKHPP